MGITRLQGSAVKRVSLENTNATPMRARPASATKTTTTGRATRSRTATPEQHQDHQQQPSTVKRTVVRSAAPVTAPRPFNLSAKVNQHHVDSPTAKQASAAGVANVVGRVSAVDAVKMDDYAPEREPVKAYLRIRPPPARTEASDSYIKVINDTDVLMIPPTDHRLSPSASSSLFSGSLLSTNDLCSATTSGEEQSSNLGTLYKFTSVFHPGSTEQDTQSSFFKATTLPLVKDFLEKGENCLLFAYGPTGSGKTWTVQGAGQTGWQDRGILPRVMDVVWQSVAASTGVCTLTSKSKVVGKSLGVGALNAMVDVENESLCTVKLDDAYNYSVCVSYAEVYNEKIYDLLESPVPTLATVSASTSSSSSVLQSGFSFFGAAGKAKSFVKGLSTVKRNALSLKHDKAGGGAKYVAGMKEVCVNNAQEAQAIIEQGQNNRRVYGTLANRASSRSHAIFTIKLVKSSKRNPSDETVRRFSIVDLAGSERVQNTGTTGDRLKEAGSINKSLMVLGQCMEVLRKNQEREKGKKPAIVPFRHSKLTEMFQGFFVGDGKAAMIVNVNPWDTSFDENSHVMKFSAVAKGVMTIKTNNPVPVMATIPVVETPKKNDVEPRLVRLSLIDGEDETDILYEENEAEDEDEEADEFVNALLDEVRLLRIALCDAQTNEILAASQARARTIQEYEQKLMDMERHYQERMREEVRAHEAELKMNAKLDILTRLAASSCAPGHSFASLQATASPRTPVSVGSSYDDSDNDDGEDSRLEDELDGSLSEQSRDESRSSREASADVEHLLLTIGEGSFEHSLTLPTRGLGRRISDVVSPTPLRQVILAPANDNDDEEEEEKADVSAVITSEEDETAGADAGEALRIDDSILSVDTDVEVGTDESYHGSGSEADEDDQLDEVAPSRCESRIRTPVQRSTSRTTLPLAQDENAEVELVVVVPRRHSCARSPNRDDDDEENQDPRALDKSVVMSVASSKKPKRKLGSSKMKDAEAIDLLSEELQPKTPSAGLSRWNSVKSFSSVHKSARAAR
ncbi:hypothetical protein OIV83_003615 [Microbotryomycetes sp. JL201]|nr:hypothetical protein OIV83_003615 [Microbotryomycetes sp. JL201]